MSDNSRTSGSGWVSIVISCLTHTTALAVGAFLMMALVGLGMRDSVTFKSSSGREILCIPLSK